MRSLTVQQIDLKTEQVLVLFMLCAGLLGLGAFYAPELTLALIIMMMIVTAAHFAFHERGEPEPEPEPEPQPLPKPDDDPSTCDDGHLADIVHPGVSV